MTPTSDFSARRFAGQIAVATTSRFFVNTSRRFVYPFAPAFSRALGVPLAAITSLIAINQATSLLALIFGPLADRWGYRVMLVGGMYLLAVGMLAVGFLPFYAVVLVALFLAGLGKSIFDPALQAYLGQQVPYHRRGLVIGLVEFGWASSSLVGIPVAGWLIERLGWQAPFVGIGLGAIGCALALTWLIPVESQQARTARPRLSLREMWQAVRGSRAAVGALGMGLFMSMANDVLFVSYGLWLEQSFGLTVVALGLATTVIGVSELVGEGLTAFLADRLGLRPSILGGLLVTALMYACLPLFNTSLPMALTGLFLVFMAFEYGMVTSISLLTEILPTARATMMSLYLAANGLGRVIGALLGGFLWLAGSLPAVGLGAAAISLLAAFCFWWGMRGWSRA